MRVADIGAGVPGLAGSNGAGHRQRPRRGQRSASRSRSAPTFSTSKRGVDEAVGELRKTLPAGLTITKVYDLAEFVATAIANVRDAILIGGVLAVDRPAGVPARLAADAGRGRHAAARGAATFVVMRLFGESINLMSMGGLAVAIGLVIDDAVVVVEGIHRRCRGGRARRDRGGRAS